ncbi:DUF5995 family protein [Rhodococcus sp. CH91]|uniref:DUF5995 family protein n=1 Tax=Rhodococcus sp. CH91 TaxID=2910256 RepID=UPI001F4ADDBE|nr:DUF5995 family protein [Rhodococcus sp. CH91]
MALHAKNIDEVLRILEGIVADTAARGDPRGCFAAVYRQMTLAVRRGIEDEMLSRLDEWMRPAVTDVLDRDVATLGKVVARPDPLTSVLVGLVHNTESKDMGMIIPLLDTL